jgi:predicted 2-oxoglutarate/Fe(II)-dependent dioxygenase YbiX
MMNNIQIIPNLVTEVECQDFIERLDPKTNGSDMYYFEQVTEKYNVKKLECKDDRFVNYVLNILKISKDKLHSAQILYYPINSRNDAHADNCTLNNDGSFKQRFKPWTHTGILYLNDTYSGGEFTFTQHRVTMKPTPGTYLVSPSDENYIHKVNRVLAGERYTLVFRFIFD